MRIDRRGRLLVQTTIWLPVELMDLVRADKLGLSEFNEQQLVEYFGLNPAARDNRDQIVEAVQTGVARQRKAMQEREAGRERALSKVRSMRVDRDAATARRRGITDALVQIAGDDSPGRLARLMPENDPHGDRSEKWEALVRRVSRLCGAEIDPAEVAAGLRALVATGS